MRNPRHRINDLARCGCATARAGPRVLFRQAPRRRRGRGRSAWAGSRCHSWPRNGKSRPDLKDQRRTRQRHPDDRHHPFRALAQPATCMWATCAPRWFNHLIAKKEAADSSSCASTTPIPERSNANTPMRSRKNLEWLGITWDRLEPAVGTGPGTVRGAADALRDKGAVLRRLGDRRPNWIPSARSS